MNAWEKRRKLSGWSGGLVEWIEGQRAFLSVVFSWQLQEAFQRAVWLREQGYSVRAGGPAVALNPAALADVAITIFDKVDALPRHNCHATVTTRGCVRNCAFCAVPKIEGDLFELDEWEPAPIICDNNLLAASKRHFDSVIDRLKAANIHEVDFNQGLDARLLTKYHADRLAELKLHCVRLAWDHTGLERQVMTAFEILRSAGIPASKIRVYVLLGFNDTPEDALYRLSTVRQLKAWPNPMRYQPVDAIQKNAFVAPGWSARELKRFMRYWANLRYVGGIPFGEYDLCKRLTPVEGQPALI